MWQIYEHKNVIKQLKKLPIEVLKRYEKWKDIIAISDPKSLQKIKGFNDEVLQGEWKGYRSSPLNVQYRIIYKIESEQLFIKEINIMAHDTGENDVKEDRKAHKQVDVSVGESVRILRELQELSQNALSTLTGIPQSTLSAIEHDKVKLGVERAKVLARALKCHPAVLVFPGWDINSEIAA